MGFCSGGITAGFFPLMGKKKPKHAALSLGDDKGTLGLQMFGADDRWRRCSRGNDGSGASARLLPSPSTPAQGLFFSVSLCGVRAPHPPPHDHHHHHHHTPSWNGRLCRRREDASEQTCKTHGDSAPLWPQPGAPTRVPRP